jgi:hypothetical protein
MWVPSGGGESHLPGVTWGVALRLMCVWWGWRGPVNSVVYRLEVSRFCAGASHPMEPQGWLRLHLRTSGGAEGPKMYTGLFWDLNTVSTRCQTSSSPPAQSGLRPAGPWSILTPGLHHPRLRIPPQRCPLHVRILVVSWQQALQDKGCESKSQGTKEDKLLKRQALAPRRDREAPEAGGSMNVEKTGKRGWPTDLEHWPGQHRRKAPAESQMSPLPVLPSWRWPSQTLVTRHKLKAPAYLSQI